MNNSDSFFSPLSPPLSLSFLFIFQLHQCDDFLNFPSHFSPLVAVFHSSSLPCISDPMIFFCSSVFFFVFFHIRPIHHFSQFSSFISISSPSISAFFLFFLSPPFLWKILSLRFLPPSISSSSSYLSYTNAMISSIFPVIFWERCSPLPHFIHPCDNIYDVGCGRDPLFSGQSVLPSLPIYHQCTAHVRAPIFNY